MVCLYFSFQNLTNKALTIFLNHHEQNPIVDNVISLNIWIVKLDMVLGTFSKGKNLNPIMSESEGHQKWPVVNMLQISVSSLAI
jgi:hypothetical protein